MRKGFFRDFCVLFIFQTRPRELYEIERKKGEALISYIGMGGIEFMDINSKPFMIQEGDIVILASDGLYRYVSEQEMLTIAENEKNAKKIAMKLLEVSQENAREIQDNASVIIIKVNGESIV